MKKPSPCADGDGQDLTLAVCGRYYSLFDKQQVAEHFHVRCTADNVGITRPTGTPLPVTISP